MQDFSCIDLWSNDGDLSAFSLPASPLLRLLLDDTNLALAKFLEDQTCTAFCLCPVAIIEGTTVPPLPLFPGPYSVPSGVTSITLEKVSEAKKRSVSLSASQVSSLETMLSGVCEVNALWVEGLGIPG